MSEDIKVLEVPCFGHPFQLGMLYDCRSHQPVPGPALWESDTLKNVSLSRVSPQSKYEVFTSDNLEEKMAILGVDSNLRLSLMTGLVNPSGTGKFIVNEKSSKKHNLARIVLKYESTLTFEELILDQAKKELHRNISSEMTATHFVSRIEFGIEAVFVFDREIDENETCADVEADLKFTIDTLPCIAVGDNGSICASELMDEEELGRVMCTFYGDETSFNSPMSYDDAVRAYSKLKRNEESHMHEAPKRVWLLPLSTLDPQLVRPLREISPHVTDALESILRTFNEFERRLSGLVKSNVCSTFSGLKKQITRCGKGVALYKKNLLKTFSSMLPVVRGGEEVEEVLTDVLKIVASSPFHQDKLSSWISGMEKKMKLLSTYLEFFKGIQLVLSLEDLDSVVSSLEYDRVVCFSLMTGDNQDALVEQMYVFLRTGSWTPEQLTAQPWHENPEIINDCKSKARNFRDFVKENEHDGRTKFIFTNVQKGTGQTIVSIQLYEGGQPMDFEPPGRPGKPFATNTSVSGITLEWKESPHGGNSVQKYTVHYKPVASGSGRDWTSLQTVGPENVITVDGLDAKTAYLFEVNSESKAGKSAVSDTSDLVVTEDSSARPKTGRSLSESDYDQHRKDDTPPDSHRLNEASGSHNSSKTISTRTSNGIESHAEPKKVTSGKDPWHRTEGRASKNNGSSNTKGVSFFVNYRLAESMLSLSKVIASGSPSLYKLPMRERMRRENSMIARQSIGKLKRGIRVLTEKVLMVVGATGAGKTTLINGMVNYILGVQWKDDFRFKLIVEDSGISQANSQTKSITAYTFYPMEGSTVPYKFTIIDTPGFGDTEGLKRDKVITSQIKEFFSIPPPNGIDHLDGVGFVTQASLARLTPPQEYIFDSVLSIFGNDVSKNIFMMLTFADGQHPPVLEAIKKANIPCDKYFKFNNSALFAENTETEESFDAMFWKMGFRSFQNFFTEFAKSESVSLRLTKEVLKERDQLQTVIEGLNPQITMGLNKIEEMRQEELILQHHEKEIETNKEFIYTVDVTKPHQIDLKGTGRHTTTCLRCNYTCHKDCAIADDREKHGCLAMNSDGNCGVCTLNCNWSEHRNLPYLIEYETVTETRTSDDLKKKYETAISGKSKVQGMIAQLEDFLQDVHSRVMTMIYQAQQSLFRLDEIALKPNPLTQVQYLELLIESEKNEAKPGWKQRVEYYQEAKRQAEILSKVKDVDAAQRGIQDRARKGDKWYHKFKFW